MCRRVQRLKMFPPMEWKSLFYPVLMELELSQRPTSPVSPGSRSLSDCRSAHEPLSATSPRAFVAVAAHVRDLQQQVSGLELAVRDETANSNRLRKHLKMEKEIRNCQEEEIKLRFENGTEQAATILELTTDLQRHRARCSDLQDSLARKEKERLQLEDALCEREARVVALERELERFQPVQVADNRRLADISIDPFSNPSLGNVHNPLDSKTLQWEDSQSNDAAAELSRLRIDYNLALQNMARFLRRSRMQQAALERAELREQQLLDEIRELRAACIAAKTDLGSNKDQLSPVLANRMNPSSGPGSPAGNSGDYSPVLHRNGAAVVRSAPSLLSWAFQFLSQELCSFFKGGSY